MGKSVANNVILVVFDTLRKDAVGAYEQKPDWDLPSIATPNLDKFAGESVRFRRAYPESLPTLPARRAIYTGKRTYPFGPSASSHKGDFDSAPGWGPIPEDQSTLAEILSEAGLRTGMISDLYHQFKPSKNFHRGFQEWQFIRGQETDPSRSGPLPTDEELDYWVPKELREARTESIRTLKGGQRDWTASDWFSSRILLNMKDRIEEEQWFNAQVMQRASAWMQQNRDGRVDAGGGGVFLTVECFDPHEPWFVPQHYRERYDSSDNQEQVISPYADLPNMSPELVARTRANYSGLVTMVDRWFGHLMTSLEVQGWLEDSMVIVVSDHGHSIWENKYIGKRGYPAAPEVVNLPLMVRLPGGKRAGSVSDALVQHHDISATILDALGLDGGDIDGRSFLSVLDGETDRLRNNVTVGWGSAVSVIDDEWWLSCKVDGTGALLRKQSDLEGDYENDTNHAAENPDVVAELYSAALKEAPDGIPAYLLELAARTGDAPGCSPFAAIPRTA